MKDMSSNQLYDTKADYNNFMQEGKTDDSASKWAKII